MHVLHPYELNSKLNYILYISSSVVLKMQDFSLSEDVKHFKATSLAYANFANTSCLSLMQGSIYRRKLHAFCHCFSNSALISNCDLTMSIHYKLVLLITALTLEHQGIDVFATFFMWVIIGCALLLYF